MLVMLGGMELRASEKPDFVQLGGSQMLAINTFPGGNVSIQNFGPTYRAIEWEGWFEGSDAMDRMYAIGNMRQANKAIDFVTEAYSYKVVIDEYEPDHRLNFYIPFKIVLRRIVQLTEDAPLEAVDRAAAETSETGEKALETVKPKSYTVKSGDVLSRIALEIYGDANAWDRIYQANNDKLSSPHIIKPGQELIIP